MTEPAGPAASTASSPTPEEISARLEALLKRTHALRAQQPPVPSGGPLTITWPPPDRELDRYDVVDVPHASPVKAAADLEVASSTPSPEPVAAREAAPVDAPAADFSKPDWSELRLRTLPDESPRASRWGWLLTVALALATLGQAGYIWYLQTAGPVASPSRIRVDGPDGAEVRIAGKSIGFAPVEHNLDAGDYDVELIDKGRVVRADRVSIGVGRTVVLLAPAREETRGAGGVTNAGAAAPTDPGVAPEQASPAANADLVSETTGAVTIESTPPGLPVTMGPAAGDHAADTRQDPAGPTRCAGRNGSAESRRDGGRGRHAPCAPLTSARLHRRCDASCAGASSAW